MILDIEMEEIFRIWKIEILKMKMEKGEGKKRKEKEMMFEIEIKKKKKIEGKRIGEGWGESWNIIKRDEENLKLIGNIDGGIREKRMEDEKKRKVEVFMMVGEDEVKKKKKWGVELKMRIKKGRMKIGKDLIDESGKNIGEEKKKIEIGMMRRGGVWRNWRMLSIWIGGKWREKKRRKGKKEKKKDEEINNVCLGRRGFKRVWEW